MGKAYLLTGKPHIGKTTAIIKIIDALGPNHCGGFYTQEIQVKGTRTGFRLKTLHGEHGILAHIDIPGPPRHGRYGVNLADLEALAIPAIHEAIEKRALIVIDEIGAMEAYSEQFRQTVIAALNNPQPILGTIALQ